MRKYHLIIGLLALFFLSGCVQDLTIVQDLDFTLDNKLTISAQVSSNDEMRKVNDVIKEINCKFSAKENKKQDGSIDLVYTSEDCVLEGVKIKEMSGGVFRYEIDSSDFRSYSSDIEEANYIIRIKGKIIDTNGINIGYNQVKFLISKSDIEDGYKYYVEYRLACSFDSECMADEHCFNSKCVKLECGNCEYIRNHKCVPSCADYESCVNNKCQQLSCGFFQKPVGHECVTYYTVVLLIVLIVFLIISTIILYNKKPKK